MKEMTTREVQLVSLDILKDVHEFCVKNKIRYSLSGGTLLGAIRHNGFIPWDDDIDIQMPRPDYDKFIHTYNSKKGYAVYSRELSGFDKKKMTYAWGRVCDTRNTYVDTGIRPWIHEDVGVWIDVLPCDGMPSDPREADEHLKRIAGLVLQGGRLGIKYAAWSNILKNISIKDKIIYAIKKVCFLFYNVNPFDDLFKAKKKYGYLESEYFFAIPHYGMKEWQPKTYMESFELHKFEDYEFYIMSGWNANLKTLYGNYMQLPPLDKRERHDFNRYYWK